MFRMGKDDQVAIREILSGDKEAYSALVVRHSPSLFRVAFRITGNEADAEDVVQEALLRGYQKLESFESRSNFGTWIYRIAVRCALDKISNRKEDKVSRAAEETDPEQDEVQIAAQSAGPDRLLLSGEIAALEQLALRGVRAAALGRSQQRRDSRRAGHCAQCGETGGVPRRA
jgi:RNA polymerase sigma-70 factor (ECF subfamily)